MPNESQLNDPDHHDVFPDCLNCRERADMEQP